jgi:hypothetical protein
MAIGRRHDRTTKQKRSIILTTAGILAVGIGLASWFGAEPDPVDREASTGSLYRAANQEVTARPTPSTAAAQTNPKFSARTANLEIERAGVRGNSSTDAEDSQLPADAMTSQPHPLWKVVGESSREWGPAIGSYQPERTPIVADLVTFDELEAGDAVAVLTPAAGEFEFNLERMENLWNGDRTYRGYLEGEENSLHPLTLTVGQLMMLASFSTPTGNYSMSYDVVSGMGWVMQNNFDQELIDYKLRDTLMPGSERQDGSSSAEDELEEFKEEGNGAVIAADEELTIGANH